MKTSMTNDKIYSWAEFKEAISELRRSANPASPYLFRGQESAVWSLDTTMERSNLTEPVSEYYHLILRIKSEIETSTGLRWSDEPSYPEMETLLADNDSLSRTLGNLPHYAYMSYLRHHGFPSPLLDWSQSPFVAAYFAFRKPQSEHVAIYAYCEMPLTYKVGSSDEPQIWKFGPYIAAHRRHFAQRSQYTVCLQCNDGRWLFKPHSDVFENQDSHRKKGRQDVLQKFILSAKDRPNVLTELSDYNLNAYSLFGSDESLMETLSIREEPK
jgi:hypothetical protein